MMNKKKNYAQKYETMSTMLAKRLKVMKWLMGMIIVLSSSIQLRVGQENKGNFIRSHYESLRTI